MKKFFSAPRSFTQFYAYDSSGDGGCYSYMTIFQTHDVLGVAAYCDQISDAGSLQAIVTAAQGWDQEVVARINGVIAGPPKKILLP